MMTVFCPSRHLERDAVEDAPVAERLRQVFELDHAATGEAGTTTDAGRVHPSSAPPPAAPPHNSTSAQNASSTRIASQPSTTARVVDCADALRAALRVEAAQAAHQRHGGAEARALHQAEPDVLEPVEQLEPLEELRRREVQQVDRGDPAGGDADGHREGGHHGEHERGGEHPRHHEVASSGRRPASRARPPAR